MKNGKKVRNDSFLVRGIESQLLKKPFYRSLLFKA
jgi:hypothetical protein